MSKSQSKKPKRSRDHHSVYVVYLRNPEGDGKAGYYVGMTGLSPRAAFRESQERHQVRPRREALW